MRIDRRSDGVAMPAGTVLEKLKKKSISATDIASQFWCEKQMELNYLYGREFTEAMKKGARLHADLKVETFVPLTVQPITYSDSMYKAAYENYNALRTLAAKGISREIKVYGSVNGYKLTGQVDELSIYNNKVLITELKSREVKKQLQISPSHNGNKISEATMRPHRIQVMLYKYMLDDIKEGRYTYDNFANSYNIKGMKLSDQFEKQLHVIGVAESLINIEAIYKKMFEEFSGMPEIGNLVAIKYIDRYSGDIIEEVKMKYIKEDFEKELMHAISYWNGQREAEPVPKEESWKCNFCRFFGNQCRVWYNE